MRILTYTATPEDAGRALRSVVPRRFSLGTHAYRRLKVQGGICVNGEVARADRIVAAGDVIEISLPSEAANPGSAPVMPGGAPSFIRYLDEDLLIVAKVAPLATLPARHIRTGTLR